MINENNRIFLGSGILHSDKQERLSNRYGAVRLYEYADHDSPLIDFDFMFEGMNGSLVAHVVHSRHSGPMGDILYKAFFNEKPEDGEEIVIGRGELFFEDKNTVGLRPNDGRGKVWMDIKNFYRAYNQTVELFFEIKNYDYNKTKT